MSESDAFWDFYWENRLLRMEGLGKREAILAASRRIRRRADEAGGRARMLELGCGEGQILGSLYEAHADLPGARDSVGIDYQRTAVEKARRSYPRLRFEHGDFTDPALLGGLGAFDLVLLVNALHEVFSDAYSETLGETDAVLGRQRVEHALKQAANCLGPGGLLLLFDGLEPPGDPLQPVRVRFLSEEAQALFEVFAAEYRPFRITYTAVGRNGLVELPLRDFTRYIDKSIFLGKRLWQTERLESYQYFTEAAFRAAFSRAGLTITGWRTFTVNEEKWRAQVAIETPGVDFPVEHVLWEAIKEEASPEGCDEPGYAQLPIRATTDPHISGTGGDYV
jgi:SAM-dependent methyltransferase